MREGISERRTDASAGEGHGELCVLVLLELPETSADRQPRDAVPWRGLMDPQERLDAEEHMLRSPAIHYHFYESRRGLRERSAVLNLAHHDTNGLGPAFAPECPEQILSTRSENEENPERRRGSR